MQNEMSFYHPNSRIIIFCPPRVVTGGPEALHQLSDKLIKIGVKNIFMYYTPKRKQNPKPENYSIYQTEEILEFEDNENTILVIPESMTDLVKKYPLSRKIVWWLSVDFYKIIMDSRIKTQKIYTKPFFKQKDREYHFEKYPNLKHWAQSFRSSVYLKENGVDDSDIDFVCDYINPSFLKNKKIEKKLNQKKVLYNPKKGADKIPKLIENSKDLEWIPIQNMNANQIKESMAESLLYVDFGENPGRDKMLRESVSQDCCIVSGKNGSSIYYEDLMIPDEYKFDFNEENIPRIIDKIKDVLENYPNHISNFETYKQTVLKEEITFEEKLKELFL